MLLDTALRRTLRNFSTLFLLVGVIGVAIHLVYGIVYRDVLAVEDLGVFISSLRPGVQVEGVSAADLAAARDNYLWVVVAQIAALPLCMAATHRVTAVDEQGGVPTVIDALTHPFGGGRFRMGLGFRGARAAAAGALVAVAIWWLVERGAILAIEPLPDRLNFIGFALARALALALAVPFALAPLSVAARQAPEASGRKSAPATPEKPAH